MCSAAVGGLEIKLTRPEIKETPDLYLCFSAPFETDNETEYFKKQSIQYVKQKFMDDISEL